MEIDKDCEVWRIATKDETRPGLMHGYLDLSVKDDPRLIATNGHALVAVPVQETKGVKEGYIPVDALKSIKKSAKGQLSAVFDKTADGKVKDIRAKVEWSSPDPGNFPDWRAVFPNPDAETFCISFNPALLLELVKSAGGNDKVSLHFAKTKGGDLDQVAPIICRVYGHDEAGLILMPMRNMPEGKGYNPNPGKAKKEPKAKKAKSKAKK